MPCTCHDARCCLSPQRRHRFPRQSHQWSSQGRGPTSSRSRDSRNCDRRVSSAGGRNRVSIVANGGRRIRYILHRRLSWPGVVVWSIPVLADDGSACRDRSSHSRNQRIHAADYGFSIHVTLLALIPRISHRHGRRVILTALNHVEKICSRRHIGDRPNPCSNHVGAVGETNSRPRRRECRAEIARRSPLPPKAVICSQTHPQSLPSVKKSTQRKASHPTRISGDVDSSVDRIRWNCRARRPLPWADRLDATRRRPRHPVPRRAVPDPASHRTSVVAVYAVAKRDPSQPVLCVGSVAHANAHGVPRQRRTSGSGATTVALRFEAVACVTVDCVANVPALTTVAFRFAAVRLRTVTPSVVPGMRSQVVPFQT